MKKLSLGIALILFGILLQLAELNNLHIPVFYWLNGDLWGLIFGIIGLIFVAIGCFEKKQ